MAKQPPDASKDVFHNPFGSLAARRDALPPGKAPPEAKVKKAPARAVVRLERKGRAGKEVTVVEKLELRGADLEAWCKELKQALGCGGAIEDGALVVQGDQRERAKTWLLGRGVAKVTVG